MQSCTVTSSKARRSKTDPTKIASQGGSCPYGIASRELNLKTRHWERTEGIYNRVVMLPQMEGLYHLHVASSVTAR